MTAFMQSFPRNQVVVAKVLATPKTVTVYPTGRRKYPVLVGDPESTTEIVAWGDTADRFCASVQSRAGEVLEISNLFPGTHFDKASGVTRTNLKVGRNFQAITHNDHRGVFTKVAPKWTSFSEITQAPNYTRVNVTGTIQWRHRKLDEVGNGRGRLAVKIMDTAGKLLRVIAWGEKTYLMDVWKIGTRVKLLNSLVDRAYKQICADNDTVVEVEEHAAELMADLTLVRVRWSSYARPRK